MTGKPPEIGPDPMDLLAAEYVFGLADDAERAEAERLLASDPAFAAAVARWQQRVSPWFDDVEDRAHASDLHDRIMAALPAAAPIAANDDIPDIRRSRSLWRGAALLMTAATLALAATLTLRSPGAPTDIAAAPAPLLLATLALDDRSAIRLSVDHQSGRVIAMPSGIVPDGVHAHELWLVPANGVPQSLGLVDPSRAHNLPAAAPLLDQLDAGAVIAVTAEPLGGSQQAGPSGPVLTSSALREI